MTKSINIPHNADDRARRGAQQARNKANGVVGRFKQGWQDFQHHLNGDGSA